MDCNMITTSGSENVLGKIGSCFKNLSAPHSKNLLIHTLHRTILNNAVSIQMLSEMGLALCPSPPILSHMYVLDDVAVTM